MDPGYFDLHLHIVPEVDDGAGDLAEATAMAKALVACGYRGAAATPHIRSGIFDNDPAKLRAGALALSSSLLAQGVPFQVVPGAEHYLDADVLAMILDGRGLPLGGSGSVYLVEAPMEHAFPGLPDKIFEMRLKGIVPLFAHPERCAQFRDLQGARTAVESGAHLQLDLGSLLGAFGRKARATAERLLEHGLYAVAATDLHDAEQAEEDLAGWIEKLERGVGRDAVQVLLGENPRRLLAGEPCLRLGGLR